MENDWQQWQVQIFLSSDQTLFDHRFLTHRQLSSYYFLTFILNTKFWSGHKLGSLYKTGAPSGLQEAGSVKAVIGEVGTGVVLLTQHLTVSRGFNSHEGGSDILVGKNHLLSEAHSDWNLKAQTPLGYQNGTNLIEKP